MWRQIDPNVEGTDNEQLHIRLCIDIIKRSRVVVRQIDQNTAVKNCWHVRHVDALAS